MPASFEPGIAAVQEPHEKELRVVAQAARTVRSNMILTSHTARPPHPPPATYLPSPGGIIFMSSLFSRMASLSKQDVLWGSEDSSLSPPPRLQQKRGQCRSALGFGELRRSPQGNQQAPRFSALLTGPRGEEEQVTRRSNSRRQ